MSNVVRKIDEHARSNSVMPAICGQSGFATYFEVIDKIARVSNFLADRNVPRKSKIALNIDHTDTFYIGALACLHYGVVPFVTGRIDRVVADGSHDYVMGYSSQLDADLPADIMIDQTILDGRLGNGTLQDFPSIDDDDLYLISSTTGTTGEPKLTAQTLRQYRMLQGGPKSDHWIGSRSMITLGPLGAYAFAMACRIFGSGGTLVRSAHDTIDILKLLIRYKVDGLLTTPDALAALLDTLEENGIAIPDLRFVRLTGSLFPTSLIERARRIIGVEIQVGYGTTEYGGIAGGVLPEGQNLKGYIGPVRKTVRFTPETLAATDYTQLVIDNSNGLAKSYYENGKILPQDDYYRLPDLGRIQDGILYLAGRADEVFNWAGNKISFARIEDALARYVGVVSVGIVNGQSEGERDRLYIGLVLSQDARIEELKNQLLTDLNISSAGDAVILRKLPDIPRNENGKIQRSELIASIGE